VVLETRSWAVVTPLSQSYVPAREQGAPTDDRMKVLYFHQHFSTPRGSTGVRSYEMSRRMVAAGHGVTMVCGSYRGGVTGLEERPFVRGRRRGVVDGIDVIEFDLAYSNSDGFAKRAWTFVKFGVRSIGLALRESCDVVFATTTPLTAGIPGIAARWLRGRKFVFEVRDLWPELPRAMGIITNPFSLGAMSVLEWTSYRSANRLIALAPGIAVGIVKRGVNSDDVVLVPNGCDLELFRTAVPWRPEGVAAGDLLAVFAGAHGIANGLDAALDAAAELKRRGRKDVRILLIGQGKLKQQLVARARAERLDNVLFHEPVERRRLAGLLRGADIGLQLLANVPAFYDGTSPNKFFDYLAAGRPVLNNYPGWVASMITESTCGFAVPPEDPSAFADALEKAASDRTALAEMGNRALDLARRRFDRDNLAESFIAAIRGVAE
jgi:glycosyltransferase involved in cell wall biosynthesis